MRQLVRELEAGPAQPGAASINSEDIIQVTQSHRPPSGKHNLTMSPAGALPGRQGEWSQSPGGAALHLPLL